MLQTVLLILAALFVVVTVLPLSRSHAWWVRMFDFPRLQIASAAAVVWVALVAVAVVAGGLGLWGWVLVAALGVAVALQAVQMLPYSPVWRVQTRDAEPMLASPDRRLRLVASNVLMQNRDGERWLSVIRDADPDVVVAVEADDWWAMTAGALTETHPHTVLVPQDDTYGMLVFSKLPLTQTEVRHLVEPEVPSLYLTAELRSGEPVSLVFLHPRPPRPDIAQDSTLRDAELVLAGRDVAQIDGPVVVAGDLNDVAWSHTTRLFQTLSGLLDPRVGRGPFSTFHAEHWWLRYPLDHVFHSHHFSLVELRRLDAVGSDHFPILIELEMDPAAAPLQSGPDAETAELDAGREMVEDAAEAKADESEAEHQERVEEDQ
ncbi:endonuclease/exonuclease/phosphatase family protein [Rubrivirga sp. IMCC45206]|uniref:endonuclease/exonuclease/phosphatase family protein n=1 Tax=Rubrivirga sp. IMCC45206 TaxID=3391614 RepID=UPI0039900E9E